MAKKKTYYKVTASNKLFETKKEAQNYLNRTMKGIKKKGQLKHVKIRMRVYKKKI